MKRTDPRSAFARTGPLFHQDDVAVTRPKSRARVKKPAPEWKNVPGLWLSRWETLGAFIWYRDLGEPGYYLYVGIRCPRKYPTLSHAMAAYENWKSR